jgi:heat shock protein HslJ
MNALRRATTLLATGLLFACAADAGSPDSPPADGAAGKPELEAAMFDPTTLVPWTFVLVDLPEAASAVGAVSTELRFAAQPDGSYVASGFGPCNQFSSPAAFTGDRVEFVQLVTTKRACADLGVETEWFARMRAGGNVKLEGARLVISRDGKQTMILEGIATPR